MSSWRSGLRGLLARGSEALREADVASAPGHLNRPPPMEFSMTTPRAARAKTTSELGRLELPTSRQQAGPASGCLISSELYEILEAQEIDEDEASNDAAARLNTTGHELFSAGYSRNATDVRPRPGDQVERRDCEGRFGYESSVLGYAQAFHQGLRGDS